MFKPWGAGWGGGFPDQNAFAASRSLNPWNLGWSSSFHSMSPCAHLSNRAALNSGWTAYLAMQLHASRQAEVAKQMKRRVNARNPKAVNSPRSIAPCTSNSFSFAQGLQFGPLLNLALLSGTHYTSKCTSHVISVNTFASLSNSSKHSIKPNGKQKISITAVLLAINAVAFFVSNFSYGRILAWGVKVNQLIDAGQFWRLLTPALLHANATHFLINSLSLNSIGPTVEAFSGKTRFLSIYILAAISGNFFSYKFNPHISLGSSAAVFGLVGSLAVFLIRHRHLLGENWKKELKTVGFTILLNLGLGLVYRDIDNWGHFGGLFGGVMASWLLGPSLFVTPNQTMVDFPPISRFLFLLKNGFKWL